MKPSIILFGLSLFFEAKNIIRHCDADFHELHENVGTTEMIYYEKGFFLLQVISY